ncbi:MAG TPA: TylF/MycF/NovP-related O-methyltransferase [Alphaproteobacteria bacterium]|nr:TylF/MycF/NovP-related O-methyltransferase [Alphaproteobacteria bacterium]
MQPTGIINFSSATESQHRDRMEELLKQCPIPPGQLASNLGLFLESKSLVRILCMEFLFKQIVNVHGSIMEFGTRWGQNMAVFAALRGIYDPFNRHRKLIAFDTFTGFPSIAAEDKNHEMMKTGALSTTKEYEKYLEQVLETHEALNPLSHIKKFEIRKGDATKEVPAYLKNNPETIVALAYFDFDLYEPTKKVLETIKPRLVKGSVLAFDELNDHESPGETMAVMEVLGLNNIKLQRFSHASRVSYCVIE